jgi:hypothetical protein
MTLDLPRRLFADRATVILALACGVALEVMLARQPGATGGAGLIVASALLLWQWRRTRRRPCHVQVSPSGVSLCFEPAGAPVPADRWRARVLGSTVVLHWHGRRGPGASQGTLWITPADLPDHGLRALRVALLAGGAGKR